MTQRQRLLEVIILGISLAFAPSVEAQQRSGFIIGGGLGPGVASTVTSSGAFSGDRESNIGYAVDVHIGGVIGDGIELYYMGKSLSYSDDVFDLIVTSVLGPGLTYPLNSDFYVNGGLGLSLRGTSITGGAKETLTGWGLVGGGGYRLNRRWVLDFDVLYAKASDDVFEYSTLGARLTINVVSH